MAGDRRFERRTTAFGVLSDPEIVSQKWYPVEEFNPYLEVRSFASCALNELGKSKMVREVGNRTHSTSFQNSDASLYITPCWSGTIELNDDHEHPRLGGGHYPSS